MANKTKQQLIVENNTLFPTNNVGAITAENLREFNTDIIDSTVNQEVYNTDSASVNNSIESLNSFTASQQPTFDALNEFTSSQLTINSGYNSVTASLITSASTLNSEVNSLQTWTGSVNEIKDDGVLQGYSTRLHFGGLVSASVVSNVDGPIASINILQDDTKLNTSSFNSYTESNDDKWAYLGTQSGSWDAASDITPLNEFTASQLELNSGYNSATASLSSSIGVVSSEVDVLQSWSSSVNEIRDEGVFLGYSTRFHFGGNVSASIVSNVGGPIASINIPFSSVDTGSLLTTASFDNGTRDLTFTKGDSSQFSVNIPDVSGSILPSGVVSGSSQIDYPLISNIPSGIVSSSSQISDITGSSLVTASLSGNTITFTKGDSSTFGFTIPDVSGSDITSLNQFTASQELLNSTFATTGSNTFTGTQTISGATNNLILTSSGGEIKIVQQPDFITTFEGGYIEGLSEIKSNIFTLSGSSHYQQYDTSRASLILNNSNDVYGIGFDVPAGSTNYKYTFRSGSAEFKTPLSVLNEITASEVKSQVYINSQSIDGFTIPTGNNAMLVGPVAINGTVVVEGTSKLIVLDQVSGSGGGSTDISALNQFTASQEIINSNLESFTSSQEVLNTTLATTGSNIFIGDQTITGSLFVSSSTTSSFVVPNGFNDEGLLIDGNLRVTNGAIKVDQAIYTAGIYTQTLARNSNDDINVDNGLNIRPNSPGLSATNVSISGSLIVSESITATSEFINVVDTGSVGVTIDGGSTLQQSNSPLLLVTSSFSGDTDVINTGAVFKNVRVDVDGPLYATRIQTNGFFTNDLYSNTGGPTAKIIARNNLILWETDGGSGHVDMKFGVSGSANISGSVQIGEVMNLKAQDPLPSGVIGDLAVSGSNLFFYNGAWTQVV